MQENNLPRTRQTCQRNSQSMWLEMSHTSALGGWTRATQNSSLSEFKFCLIPTNRSWTTNLTRKPTITPLFSFMLRHLHHHHHSLFIFLFFTFMAMSFKLIVDGLLSLKSSCFFYENWSSSPLQNPSINLTIKHQIDLPISM